MSSLNLELKTPRALQGTDLIPVVTPASGAGSSPDRTAVVSGADVLNTVAEATVAADRAEAAADAALSVLPPVTFNTVAALRASEDVAEGAVNLLRYYTAGDGGGGLLHVDPDDTTSTDNGGTVFVNASGQRIKRTNTTHMTSAQWGIRTTENQTARFQALGDWIDAIGGGVTIEFLPGTYEIGLQTLAGATGLGYSWRGQRIIRVEGATKPITFRGNGAKIRWANGLRAGAFNPVTGAPITTTPPYYVADSAADIEDAFWFWDCPGGVVIEDFEIDGNLPNLIIGGQWGDVGWQRRHTGILAYSTPITVRRVKSYGHVLDGIITGQPGSTETSPEYPVLLENCDFSGNARQGWSHVGGLRATAINCKFNDTGRASLANVPGAGIDLEAELAVVRDVQIINCECVGNVGVGLLTVGDVARVRVEGGIFAGDVNWALWLDKPDISINGATIIGGIVNAHPTVKFIDCNISDRAAWFGNGYSESNYLVNNPGIGVLFERCNFDMARNQLWMRGTVTRNCTLRVGHNTTTLANAQPVWLSNVNSVVDGLVIEDAVGTTNAPANGYYIEMFGEWTGRNLILPKSGTAKVFWGLGLSRVGRLGQINTRQSKNEDNQLAVFFDQNATLTVGSSAELNVWAGPLTADRTVTLSTTDAFVGAILHVVREGGGAFNLTINGASSPVVLASAGTGARFIWTGSIWFRMVA